MNCRIEEIDTFGRKLHIDIPAADFNERVVAKLRKLSTTAKIKGFRPGKVPLEIIKRYYGEEVENDVIAALIRENYIRAVEKHSFHTMGIPSFEDVEVDTDKGIKYTAYIEVLPDLQLNTYEDITIEKPFCDITETDVDAMVERVRKSNPKWQVKDGPACVDDKVTINMSRSGTDEEPIFEDKSYVLGSEPLGKYLDTQIENMHAGEEKEISFKEHTCEEPVDSDRVERYTVHLKLVEKPILPELDDDFFKVCGIEEGGLDALRSSLLEGMEAEAKRKISQLYCTNIENAMLTHANIKAPPAILKEEIEKIKKRLADDGMSYSDRGISDELLEKTGKRRVCLNILFTYINKKNNFKADRNACEAKIDQLAQDYKEPERIRSHYRSNANAYRQIEDMVVEDKIIDYVAKEAKVGEKKYSFYELMGMEQTQQGVNL